MFISAAGSIDYPEVITCADVTLFGIICALASFDRQELRKRIVESIDFRAATENVKPYASACLSLAADFCSGQYSDIFTSLEELYPFLKVDVYMSSHVDNLYELIREKCIAQYFTPYSSLDIRKMSECLQIPLDNLDQILVKMISSDQIDAVIDSQTKILYRRKQNELSEAYNRIAHLGKTQLRDLKGILLRLSFIKNGFSLETENPIDVGIKSLGNAGSFDDIDQIDDGGDAEMDVDQFEELP